MCLQVRRCRWIDASRMRARRRTLRCARGSLSAWRVPDSTAVTIGYERAGASLSITFAEEVTVWDVMDYLAKNFQRPNAAADARLDAVLAARESVVSVVNNNKRRR